MVDLMDSIDFSRDGDRVPQRQHRIVPRNMYPVCFCVSHIVNLSNASFSRTCCLFDS